MELVLGLVWIGILLRWFDTKTSGTVQAWGFATSLASASPLLVLPRNGFVIFLAGCWHLGVHFWLIDSVRTKPSAPFTEHLKWAGVFSGIFLVVVLFPVGLLWLLFR